MVADRDPTVRRVPGPTPAGGAYAVAYFLDDRRDSARESRAAAVEVVEFDESGRELFRTYAAIRSPRRDDVTGAR